jgi:N-acetylglucosamine-6-phosphate deacetylase
VGHHLKIINGSPVLISGEITELREALNNAIQCTGVHESDLVRMSDGVHTNSFVICPVFMSTI